MFRMFKKSLLFKILGTVLLITIVGFGVLVYEVIDQERNGLLEERKRVYGPAHPAHYIQRHAG